MKTAGLSLEQAPPISIPFKFFLTAALFSVAAGMLVMLQGEALFVSRWSPLALGLTHLVTAGFLTQVMTGSMIQLLPVLAGAPLPSVVIIARLVHMALLIGALLLAGGFIYPDHGLLIAGAVLLTSGFMLFLGAVAIALLRPGAPREIGYAFGIGWVALIPTLTLGLILAFGFSGLMPISDMPRLVDLHLSWGLLGWVGMVLFAVVFRLVPIFYVTQEFPPWLRTLALPAVLVLLLVLSFSRLLNGGQLDFSLLLIVLIFTLCTVMVFRVLHRRKRRIVDASMLFIWTGMASLPVSAVVWATSDNEIVLGSLLLGGVCLNMPIGLIYKVIPFLCWFHLQGLLIRREKFSHELPSMKHFITEKSAKWHYYLHLAALLFLLAASEYPHSFGRLSGMLLTLSSLFFFRNILHALRAFRKLQSTLSA